MAGKSNWTAWHVSELLRRAENKKSAGQIAAAFGDGFTRNSVIGKASRLGIQLNSNGRAKPPPLVSIMELKNGVCRFPIGDPRDDDFGYCGAQTPDDGGPYCCEHRLIAYTGKASSDPKPAFWLKPIGASCMLGEAAE